MDFGTQVSLIQCAHIFSVRLEKRQTIHNFVQCGGQMPTKLRPHNVRVFNENSPPHPQFPKSERGQAPADQAVVQQDLPKGMH